tara:strand:- start:344 stop:556 length:213 start_codon:yes stop_codon:yes gene_type:complete
LYIIGFFVALLLKKPIIPFGHSSAYFEKIPNSRFNSKKPIIGWIFGFIFGSYIYIGSSLFNKGTLQNAKI